MSQLLPSLRTVALAGALLHATVGHADSSGDGIEQPVMPVAQPVITVSKASDGLGAAIELRPIARMSASAAGMAVPALDRLPLSGRLTSRFGMRGHPVLGGYRQHSGVDLAAPTGSPVLATADGVVTFADWRGGYGLLVSVEHGGGLQTRFGHLSRIMVRPGERISKGQLVGLVGSTGRSTGSHLHYEVRRNGSAVDPLSRR
ncbi:M23 family metallopeptidase [Tsuneonella sp. HG249]